MIFIERILMFFLVISIFSCDKGSSQVKKNEGIWKNEFQQIVPMLGHRNWIIIADKAFPQQSADGIEMINTDEKMEDVLKFVIGQIDASSHVKPIIYRDLELNYLKEQQAKGVTDLTRNLRKVFANRPVKTMLHDSVFSKLNNASKLFKVVIFKTNETVPYSSVLLELDCAYWNAEKESQLRKSMR